MRALILHFPARYTVWCLTKPPVIHRLCYTSRACARIVFCSNPSIASGRRQHMIVMVLLQYLFRFGYCSAGSDLRSAFSFVIGSFSSYMPTHVVCRRLSTLQSYICALLISWGDEWRYQRYEEGGGEEVMRNKSFRMSGLMKEFPGL